MGRRRVIDESTEDWIIDREVYKIIKHEFLSFECEWVVMQHRVNGYLTHEGEMNSFNIPFYSSSSMYTNQLQQDYKINTRWVKGKWQADYDGYHNTISRDKSISRAVCLAFLKYNGVTEYEW